MKARTFWLDLFTGTTWNEFLDSGANVSGFRESRWHSVQRMRPGDYLLCYLTGVSRFIGVLEVTSAAYKDTSPIWKDAVFPCRVKVKPAITLTPETAVPIQELRNKLTIFSDLSVPHAWTGRLRGSPSKWKASDGEAILVALHDAKENPVKRPVDPRKMARRPRALTAKIGPVTVPDENEDEVQATPVSGDTTQSNDHTEMQHLLLKLGSDMGFDIWVARNDRNREFRGKCLSDYFKLKDSLPLQFDVPTTRTIEYIDVLWLKGNAIAAAFEVESTTSIYSGLLRMSDLVAMQPNLNIPLYLVAPDDRRSKVFAEVNRPTFTRLTPPLVDVCRFISFSTLKERLSQASAFLQYLKPEFLEELSEVCDVDEE